MVELALESKIIHGGIDGDPATGAVNVPILPDLHLPAEGIGRAPGLRSTHAPETPPGAALEKLIADLEGGDAGFAFASGMAAIGATLMLLNAGDRVLVPGNVYGGTYRILDKVFSRFGLTYSLVDASDPERLEKEIPDDAKMLLVESPANPLDDGGRPESAGRSLQAQGTIDGGGQYIPDALLPAPHRAWRGHRDPQRHEIPWRALGPRRGGWWWSGMPNFLKSWASSRTQPAASCSRSIRSS